MMNPAGSVHSTIGDLALYAHAHLQGLKGREGLLQPELAQTLRTAPDDDLTIGPASEGYAMGWGLRREGDQLVHWHNGNLRKSTFHQNCPLILKGIFSN
jgi:CubicO group peptidase (beta-lactamase class C family)